MEVLLTLPRAAAALLLTACASTTPLSPTDASTLATRTWDGATDEVFDATWLTLERSGFEITQDDRLAGTLKARRENREWNVDVSALGNEQRVKLTPSTPLTRADLSELLDTLEEGTAKLLRAWHEPPEWKFDGRKNLLFVAGFAVSPPLEWAFLDFDLNRRVVTVQKSRARNAVNPTMRVELDRARPRSLLLDTARQTIALSLSARQRLVFPEPLEVGTIRVLDGTTASDATWAAQEWPLDAWQVRIAVSCAGTSCLAVPRPRLEQK